jgi:hypothetical protein
MRNLRLPACALSLALWTAPTLAAPAKHAPVSDVIRARRPAGGEWFGLYLLDKKVGYVFNHVTFAPGSKDKVESVSRLVFKANVGNRTAQRTHEEIRVYEAKPGGRLLSFRFVDHGDGGDQELDGVNGKDGMTVVRKRPGHPDETLTRPPSPEKVEDADPVRVAILRQKTVEGKVTSPDDLEPDPTVTTLAPPEERLVGGVKLKLQRAVTISDKEKVPVTTWLTAKGESVEVDFGQQMQARAEPKEVAQRLDQVEVFGLTRVVLPKAPPEGVRRIPGKLGLVVTGLPERFRKASYRQKFEVLPGDKVAVTLLGVAPDPTKLVHRPVAESEDLREYLKSTLAVESDDKRIRATAKKIVGKEKNAYAAAKKIVAWVGRNMESDYGASADRATDVLRQMKGDCTEHSLLAETLLRAAGIPARRVDGLIYVMNDDGVPALYWHEWVEAYVGEWTQMDPTFRETVADATHLALGEEGNAEITPLIGALKVLEVR